MIVTTEEFKSYAHILEDDPFVDDMLLQTAHDICKEVARAETEEELAQIPGAKLGVLCAASYLYDRRETANFLNLKSNLRKLLFPVRSCF